MDDTVKFPSLCNNEKQEDEGRISAASVIGKEMETAGPQGNSSLLEQCLFCVACFVMG